MPEKTSSILSLASLESIGAYQVHPHTQEIYRISYEEARQFDIWLPNSWGYATMSPHVFPSADVSVKRLVDICLLNNLLFYLDDVFDRNRVDRRIDDERKAQLFRLAYKALETGQMPDISPQFRPLLTVVVELQKRFSSFHPDWWKRFLNNMRRHLEASNYNMTNVEKSDDIMSAYIEMRILDSGMDLELDLIEYAFDFVLPDEMLSNSVIKRGHWLCSRIGLIMNDLFSYHREAGTAGDGFNLLAVLMRRGYSSSKATSHIINIVNESTREFIQLREKWPTYPDAHRNEIAETYYTALQHMINGTFYFQIASARYKSSNSLFVELQDAPQIQQQDSMSLK